MYFLYILRRECTFKQIIIHLVSLLFSSWNPFNATGFFLYPEAAVQRCSEEKMFWKYAAILQENTHVEVWFQ